MLVSAESARLAVTSATLTVVLVTRVDLLGLGRWYSYRATSNRIEKSLGLGERSGVLAF